MAISCIKKAIRLLNPSADQQISDEDQKKLLKFVDAFPASNNFTRDWKNTSMSYGDKRRTEEMLLKYTSSFMTTSSASIEATQESLSQVDDLMDEDGRLAEKKERFTAHVTTIAAAYYNLGASSEHLGKLDLALCAYHRGLNFCQKYVPQTSTELIQTLNACINQLSSRYSVCQANSMRR